MAYPRHRQLHGESPYLHPVVGALAEARCRGHTKNLDTLATEAETQAQLPTTEHRTSVVLLIAAADTRRTLDQLEEAQTLLLRARARLPGLSLDLLNEITRLQIELLLDQHEFEKAQQQTSRLNALEVEQSGTPPLFFRSLQDVDGASWSLICQVALARKQPAEAREALEHASTRLLQERQELAKELNSGAVAALRRFDPDYQHKSQQLDETTALVDLLTLALGPESLEEKRATLSTLLDSTPAGPQHARIAAALGRQEEGINAAEQSRWQNAFQMQIATADSTPPRPAQAVAELTATAALLLPAEVSRVLGAETVQTAINELHNALSARNINGAVTLRQREQTRARAGLEGPGAELLLTSGKNASLQIALSTAAPLQPELQTAARTLAELTLHVLQNIPASLPKMPPITETGLVLASEAMREVYEWTTTLAHLDGVDGTELAHILLQGETGVGKELIAREIHRLSRRASRPWVSENLAGMPPDLVRSTIFGHVKGAFTGADSDQPGLFEAATHGTLLLDEFGEFDLNLQAIILRVLEEQKYLRIGEKKGPREFTSRIILSTNRNIDDPKTFRQDILYRCRPIRIPPLRDRRDDIAPLVGQFVGAGREVSEGAVAWCETQPWPGNVRQLRSVVQDAAALAQRHGQQLAVSHLVAAAQQFGSARTQEPTGTTSAPAEGQMATAVAEYQRALVLEAAERARSEAAGGKWKFRAAEIYGVARTTYNGLLKKHDIKF